MPLPTPREGESQKDFEDRCTADPVTNEEYPESEQRYAVCRSQWEKKDAKSQSPEGKEETIRRMPAEPDWLRAEVTSDGVQVDRQNNVIHGYVVAQEGHFKSEGRGQFDHKSLRQIVKLIKAAPGGLKSRFGHPTLSDDGLAKFLGRAKNPRLDHIGKTTPEGEKRPVEVVRADLHLDPTSFSTPAGNLGKYVLDRAESDPASFATSLVLKSDKEMVLDSKGRPKRDAEGNDIPPLWRPVELHASDVVDTGDAVDSFLSAPGLAELPDGIVREATVLLERQFGGQDREVIRARCLAWLDRYLMWKFGPVAPAEKEESYQDISPEISPEEPLRRAYDPAADAEKLRIRRRRRRAADRTRP